MADLHKEFSTFYERIRLTAGKKESLRQARDAIRSRIRKYFRETLKILVPKFHGQGSFAMGTTINPLNGEFDIDDGVYLQHLDTDDKTKWPTPETVHSWLVKATDGHTDEKPIDKKTCVRVVYAGQYHVDLPAYAEFLSDYLLAEKGVNGWHKSDPRALTDWFVKGVGRKGEQLRRIVGYLKAWADFQSGRRGKMPSGLILTVLATENFSPDGRDDVSLTQTAKAISAAVNPFFYVANPVDVSEELTKRLSDEQKKRFQEAIQDLAKAGMDATAVDDASKASKIWRGQFGDRFPIIEKPKTENSQKETATTLAAAYIPKNPSKPWGYR